MSKLDTIRVNGVDYELDCNLGDAVNSDKIDGYHLVVVSTMPASPAEDTIYIVK